MIIKRELLDKIELYLTNKEAIIITGMRRVGKTTLLNFIFDKIESDNKLYLDLENPLNQKYFEEQNFEKIKFTLETLGLDFNQKSYVFLDEIQLVKNIPQVVKFLMDHYPVKFFLIGSASFYLKNLFSESLAGRKYVFELFPFSFKEFLEFKQVKLKLPQKHSLISASIFETISHYYDEYLRFGGFPQVIAKTTIQEKKKILNDIFSAYFQLEVKQLSDFRKLDKIRDLILLLAERTGSKLDIKKLADELNISRATVYEFLSFLEGTYLIKLIKPFSPSRDVEIRKIPKVYFCDVGFLNQLGQAEVNRGSLFEQTVFQSLRPKGEINYYQTKSGKEIDFILNKKQAYEVKIKPEKRDTNNLTKTAKSLRIKSCQIVSLRYVSLDKVIFGFEI